MLQVATGFIAFLKAPEALAIPFKPFFPALAALAKALTAAVAPFKENLANLHFCTLIFAAMHFAFPLHPMKAIATTVGLALATTFFAFFFFPFSADRLFSRATGVDIIPTNKIIKITNWVKIKVCFIFVSPC